MKTLDTAGTGIHMKQFVFLVIYYFEDMRMTTNVELWFFFENQISDPCIVSSWVAPNMGYQNFYPFAAENLIFRELASQNMTINVAVDRFQWFFVLNLITNGFSTNISSMPNLISLFYVFEYLMIQVSVSVR